MQTFLQNSNNNALYVPLAVKRLLIFFILITALAVRLYHIRQPYTDLAGWRQTSVAMMADNFYHRNPNILYPEVSWNGPGLSYNGREFQTVSYFSNLLYRVVGQHDWVGRLVAILFGVWGVFALYQLVRRVWDENRAFASAAMLALLPAGVFFDRNFLPDPVMVSLVTTSVWMLVAYLQTDQKKYLLLTALMACWGFLTKVTGMLVLLPMLYALISIYGARKKLTAKNLLMIALPGLLVIGIVAAYYSWARYLSNHYPPYHFAGSNNWLWDEGLKTWLHEGYFLKKASYIFLNWTWGWPFIALCAAGFVLSLIPYSRKKEPTTGKGNNAPLLFHFWLIGCTVFYMIGAKELIGNFWNFHIWSPAIAAFAGTALIFIIEALAARKTLALLALMVIAGCIAFSDYKILKQVFTDQYYKSDYNMGVQLKTLRKEGDLVVVLAREIGCPIAIYYSGGRGWVLPPAGNTQWDKLPLTSRECITILEDLRQKGAAWFAVHQSHYDTFEKEYPEFAQHLSRQYPLRAQQPDYKIFQLQTR